MFCEVYTDLFSFLISSFFNLVYFRNTTLTSTLFTHVDFLTILLFGCNVYFTEQKPTVTTKTCSENAVSVYNKCKTIEMISKCTDQFLQTYTDCYFMPVPKRKCKSHCRKMNRACVSGYGNKLIQFPCKNGYNRCVDSCHRALHRPVHKKKNCRKECEQDFWKCFGEIKNIDEGVMCTVTQTRCTNYACR